MIRLSVGCRELGGLVVDVGGGLVRDAAGRDLLRPTDDERDADAAFVKLTLASAQRRVGGHVGFPAVVGAENDDRVFVEAKRFEFVGDQSDTVVDALKHGGEMRVVVAGPVVLRIPGERGVLTEVTALARAFTGWMLFAVLGDQLRFAVEDGVRRVVTEEQKERPVLVTFDELHGLVVEAVGEVLTPA